MNYPPLLRHQSGFHRVLLNASHTRGDTRVSTLAWAANRATQFARLTERK